MKCRTRSGNLIETYDNEGKIISFLYTTPLGRIFLKIMISPIISKACGLVLSSKLSTLLINPFINKNNMDLSDYPVKKYKSFNDFFTRKIIEAKRTITNDPSKLISPCDGKLTLFKLNEDSHFTIKGSDYTLSSLLKNDKIASEYIGGYGILFRLTVDDYHRYIYPISGIKSKNVHINGCFHTVNPKAASALPIYKENSREYTIIKSDNYGNVLMMEIGAMLVGKIKNHHEETLAYRGTEKGYFEFGGSSIILLIQKDHYLPDNDLLVNSSNNEETIIKMGEEIGSLI